MSSKQLNSFSRLERLQGDQIARERDLVKAYEQMKVQLEKALVQGRVKVLQAQSKRGQAWLKYIQARATHKAKPHAQHAKRLASADAAAQAAKEVLDKLRAEQQTLMRQQAKLREMYKVFMGRQKAVQQYEESRRKQAQQKGKKRRAKKPSAKQIKASVMGKHVQSKKERKPAKRLSAKKNKVLPTLPKSTKSQQKKSKKPSRSITLAQKAQVKQLFEQGQSQTAIARAVGIGRTSVGRLVKETVAA